VSFQQVRVQKCFSENSGLKDTPEFSKNSGAKMHRKFEKKHH